MVGVVLAGLDLKIRKGEFVSFIGPSGCGKSTVLKLIAGLTSPTQGTIRVDGMTPKDARETVSFIFQDATLLPWRPVEQNVGLGLELDGVTKTQRQEKTAALLKLVGLEHVAKFYPRELSGGMKMRVSIARALATSPKLLLMDEPFAALDEMSRDRLNEELLRLKAEQGWTGVFVTHSVEEAVFLSSESSSSRTHPGRIHEMFAIDLPFPRTAALRETPEFAALVAQGIAHFARRDRTMKQRLMTVANAIAVFAALLLIWQLVLWIFHVPPYMLPSPLAVTRVAVEPLLFASRITGHHRGGIRRRADRQHRRRRLDRAGFRAIPLGAENAVPLHNPFADRSHRCCRSADPDVDRCAERRRSRLSHSSFRLRRSSPTPRRD